MRSPTIGSFRGTPTDQDWVRLYQSLVAHYLFQQIHTSYFHRSRGSSDDLGNTWEPISVKTAIYRDLRKRGRLGPKGILNQEQYRIWKGIYAHHLKRGKTEKEAAKLAWNIVKAKHGGKTISSMELRSRASKLILIDTRRLIDSFKAGTINDRWDYVPPNQDQIIKFTRDTIEVGSHVPYADKVEGKRPILPDNWTIWLERAKKAAQDQVVRLKRGYMARHARKAAKRKPKSVRVPRA